jgi:5-methylcytosine-specific restriction endonuclease McrA
MAEWRKRNAERLKAYSLEYYAANRGACIATAKRYIAANPDRTKEARALRSARDREKDAAKYAEWYAANSGKNKAKCAAYRAKHRERILVRNANRRALKRNADGEHSEADIQRLFTLQRGKCAGCRAKLDESGKHIDHVLPLILGGGNGPHNIQLLCPTCNLKKGARDPVEWAQRCGRLL